MALVGGPLTAQAQVYLPPMGGRGGEVYKAPCPDGQNLRGVEVRTGDDVDAVRPLCATATGPRVAAVATAPGGWNGGAGGSHVERLVCPASAPVVLQLKIGAEGQKTLIINNIWLYCGEITATPQTPQDYPSAIFDGPRYNPTGGLFPSLRRGEGASQQCPPGQVASGLHGRAGAWVDAIALICDAPRLQRPGVSSIGRVSPATSPPTDRTICESARDARARNSPAAPRLEQRCRAAGGD